MRKPTMEDALETMLDIMPKCGEIIIDVGVMRSTKFLMDYFGASFHYLFEPVLSVHDVIKENYSGENIDFELHGIALSDKPGKMYLHEKSINEKLEVTHSNLSGDAVSESPEVTVRDIEVSTLDLFFEKRTLPDLEYIVKMDVDGFEDKIIQGGPETIENASFVIIEAPMKRVLGRLSALDKLGFSLFDIVDPAYYRRQLWQVDLILINNRLRAQEQKFRPREYTGGKIDLKCWHRYRG